MSPQDEDQLSRECGDNVEPKPRSIRDIVSRDVIEDLWGCGYTILPRRRGPDPFHLDQGMIPATRSYQWMHLVNDKIHIDGGWTPVPASRHDGYFMPAGHIGNIEVSGLGLFEKPKFEVEAERAQSHAKAHQNVADWVKDTGAEFFGSVSFGDVSAEVGDPTLAKKIAGDKAVDPKTKTINTTVGIPLDMIPHMRAIFTERDMLYANFIDVWEADSEGEFTKEQYGVYSAYVAAASADPSILKGPALNALLLPIAVENVRKRIAEQEKKS